jgi:hypothetical protein
MESEIQPLILLESAARAASNANEKTTTNEATIRFTSNLLGNTGFSPSAMMAYGTAAGQAGPVYGF